MDLQLEAVHGWRHADIVLNRVKRSEDPIDAGSPERCLTEAGDEIDKLDGDNFDPHVKHEYPFSEMSKFLYAYMINKLNTDLHDRIISIEEKNGFEVYRQVAKILDAVPENALFIMDAELLQLATQHGPKVRDICSSRVPTSAHENERRAQKDHREAA